MPNNTYWEDRQVMDAYEVFRDAEEVADAIAEIYWKASGYITNEAKDIFERFRDRYGLTDQEAWQLINTLQDSTSIDELIQKLKNVHQSESIRELRKKLESQAYRARLERLKDLSTQLDRVMQTVYRQELTRDTSFLEKLASESFYKGIFRLQQRANAAFSFARVDHKVIDKVLNMNWSGMHYSNRIWKNTRELAKTLKEELIVNLITGRSEREAAEIINEKFAGGASAARRLVRTESNYVSTELKAAAWESHGIEEYIYAAQLDLKTSKICRSLDRNIYPLSERKVGKNCPPMHPWCRSTIAPIIDRELLQNMTRAALDPSTGKRIKIPATMTYQEWYDKYVKGKPETEAKEKAAQNQSADRKQYERYSEVLGDNMPDSLVKFQEMKYNKPKEWSYLKGLKRYLERYPTSNKKYYDASLKLEELGIQKGILLPPVQKRAFILPEGKRDPYHIMKRMLERNITDDDIRGYMSNAKGMFVQWGGRRQLFVGKEGMCLVTNTQDGWIYKTAWSERDYDEESEMILEVLKDVGL